MKNGNELQIRIRLNRELIYRVKEAALKLRIPWNDFIRQALTERVGRKAKLREMLTEDAAGGE